MMKRIWMAALGMAMMAAAGERGLAAEGAAGVQQSDAFAAELFSQLAAQRGRKNLFVSPYSVWEALAMTAQGARGQTRAQMDTVLHIGDLKAVEDQMMALRGLSGEPGAEGGAAFTLSIANALWVDETFPLQADFVTTAQDAFHAQANALDFVHGAEAARGRINAWVEKQTKDKIKDLLPAGSVDASTAMVLTNAVYFKAAWQFPFPESATSDKAFQVDGTHEVKAPMMRGPSGTFLNYMESDDFQAVAMPYQMTAAQRKGAGPGGGGTEMVLIVPKKVDGLGGVEKEATAENLGKWIGAMAATPVQVYLPRFKMTSSLELTKPLEAMGMKEAFSSGADFSGISAGAGDRLRISAVVHKAYVDVNEAGTEAAAATGVTMMRMAMVANKAVIRADRPFLFLIRDRGTGAVLFMGQVVDPGK